MITSMMLVNAAAMVWFGYKARKDFGAFGPVAVLAFGNSLFLLAKSGLV